MAKTLRVFDPTPRPSRNHGHRKNTLQDLSGATVGFIDNAKPNFDHLVDDLSELLVGRYGVSRVIKRRKPTASLPAVEAIYQELAEHCDLVITGSGD